MVSVIVSSKLETATLDSVLFRAGSSTICLTSTSLCFTRLVDNLRQRTPYGETGPLTINVEHRLETDVKTKLGECRGNHVYTICHDRAAKVSAKKLVVKLVCKRLQCIARLAIAGVLRILNAFIGIRLRTSTFIFHAIIGKGCL